MKGLCRVHSPFYASSTPLLFPTPTEPRFHSGTIPPVVTVATTAATAARSATGCPTISTPAIATASNIGSACSPIGNPQNMIIALLGRVYFSSFLGSILLASVGGLALNTLLIARVYARDLAPDAKCEPTHEQLVAAGMDGDGAAAGKSGPTATAAAAAAAAAAAVVVVAVANTPGTPHEKPEPATTTQRDDAGVSSLLDTSVQSISATSSDAVALSWGEAAVPTSSSSPAPASSSSAAPPPAAASSSSSSSSSEWAPIAPWRRTCILVLLALLPVIFVLADRWIGLTWISLLGAAVLCVLDGGRPEPLLRKVDGTLLLFFSGLFVTVAGFNATGVPTMAWDALSGSISMRSGSGVFLFTLLVVVGSNTVSNVPLTLILAPSLSLLPSDAPLAWLLLAWISTVAGNLTLLGSVANLIVAERAKDVSPVTFVEYLKVGTPSTLLLLAVGTPVVWACAAAITAGG
jgi:Na+/H+ antiporter NhaD/arsenite permease-like protein